MREVERMLAAVASARGFLGGLRVWCGALSDIGDERNPAVSIAMHMGCSSRAPLADALREISGERAAEILAFLASNSLAYPRATVPSQDVHAAISAGLDDLGPNLCLYTNGDWPQLAGWSPLTNATFDAGVIGHTATVGFLLWVEEED